MATTPKGSIKLAYILDCYPQIKIENSECADLGCNVGGFTRELLSRGASLVHAIDTGYGTLDWDLRQDDRVDVRERQNALHADWLKNQDVIVSDVAWTRQEKIVPAAFLALNKGGSFFSLLKPQYELLEKVKRKGKKNILAEEQSQAIAQRVFEEISCPESHKVELHESPVLGGQDYKGNREYWLAFTPC
ncbi:MAG: hypothetical protein HQL32_12235 [Planctomycetes bacterium]|nr:hypothetical protein [Planctomycetota bacterium]